MAIKLFNIKEDGLILPTEHCYTIGYLKDIIDEYGVENAGKVFAYFHYMWSMNPDENAFYNLSEYEKKEVICRTVVPPTVDIDDPLIEEGLELVGKLYETSLYKVHKGFKGVLDKLATSLNYVHVSLDKEDGNAGELDKASKLYKNLIMDYKSSFKEMMEEMGVTEARGGRRRNKYSGKSEELD